MVKPELKKSVHTVGLMYRWCSMAAACVTLPLASVPCSWPPASAASARDPAPTAVIVSLHLCIAALCSDAPSSDCHHGELSTSSCKHRELL